jgi:hypothetical protein
VIRISSQTGAYPAGTGAKRRTAGGVAALAVPSSSRHRAPVHVEIDFVPQGGAKAP